MNAVLLSVIMIATTNAQAHDVRECQQIGIGIETLVTPVASNVQSFYEGRVQIYNVDTIEPAAASAGIAIVLPEKDNPLGSSKCLAIVHLGRIDIREGRAAYDPAKGLAISIPTRTTDLETGKLKPAPALKILINMQQSSVTIAQDPAAKRGNRASSPQPPTPLRDMRRPGALFAGALLFRSRPVRPTVPGVWERVMGQPKQAAKVGTSSTPSRTLWGGRSVYPKTPRPWCE
jgi:hypothetical protein